MTSPGLSSQEARRRLLEFGPNSLPTKSKKSLLRVTVDVLREPMLLLLLIAGFISFLVADLSDALLLLITVVIVLTISIYQHKRIESALSALHQLTVPLALLTRDGIKQRIPSVEVVSVIYWSFLK
jgi:Ca2+-transporting ATPase